MKLVHGLVLLLAGGCGSSSPAENDGQDAAGPRDLGAESASDAKQVACAVLPASATCHLSGPYDLSYEQIKVESTPDSSGMACRQVTPLQRLVFTASAERLCADVDELAVTADGCEVTLTSRWRMNAASEYWDNETVAVLKFASQDGGTLAGKGTARLRIGGYYHCTETATVTAHAP